MIELWPWFIVWAPCPPPLRTLFSVWGHLQDISQELLLVVQPIPTNQPIIFKVCPLNAIRRNRHVNIFQLSTLKKWWIYSKFYNQSKFFFFFFFFIFRSDEFIRYLLSWFHLCFTVFYGVVPTICLEEFIVHCLPDFWQTLILSDIYFDFLKFKI